MFRALTVAAIAIAAPAVAATTIQQDFDAAQALLDAQKFPEARDAFRALLGRFSPTSQGKAANLVRARLGNALVATGDHDAAEKLLTAAAASFSGTTPQDIEERGVALYDLGRAQESLGKLDSAAKTYGQVRAAGIFPVDGPIDISLRVALARTLIWSNPAEARQLLDTLLAMPPATFGKSRDSYAQLQTLRGRVELNNNNAAEAKRWFTKAASTAGGAETRKVSVADVRIRGDLALANYKLGDMDAVQKNIALTGSGTLVGDGLSFGGAELPDCAPLSGLSPDAMAVVEFAIADDGHTAAVTPVYATRGSGAAKTADDEGPESQFVDAVRQWSWSKEGLAKIDPFWRQAVRYELRCFTRRAAQDPLTQSFRRALRDWRAAAGVVPTQPYRGSDAQVLPAMVAELARREREHGPKSLQLLPPLGDIARNTAANDADRLLARNRVTDIMTSANAPTELMDYLQLEAVSGQSMVGGTRADQARLAQAELQRMLERQVAAGAGNSRIAMLTRLRLAEAVDDRGDKATARQYYEQLIAAPQAVLPDSDPIRTVALIHIANLAAAARDTDTAASAFAATGLTAEQCALVDVRPQPVNTAIGQNVFPLEARRWMNGGIVKVGFDIAADGSTANIRVISASPPMIYGQATEKAIARFQYRPVFRPGNTLGCTGNTQAVRYTVNP